MSASIFIENLAQEMANNNWNAEPIARNVNLDMAPESGFVESTKIDLYAARRSVQYWRAYVKVSPQLIDGQTFQDHVRIYNALRNKAQSWTIGNVTILCLVTESGVSQDVISKVNDYSIHFFQMKGGGCLLCIVDMAKRAVYMRIPSLPIPVHNISKEFTDIVKRTLTK